MFYEENKNKTMYFLHIILSINDSIQQQIHFNGIIFGHLWRRCKEDSLYFDTCLYYEKEHEIVRKWKTFENDEGTYKNENSLSVYIFYARQAGFGQLGLINSKFPEWAQMIITDHKIWNTL